MASTWKTVQCVERPDETDTKSSPTTVYQRKGFKQVQVENSMGGEPTTLWEYQERELTRAEWDNLNSLPTQTIMQAISDLQVDVALMGV